MTDTSSDNYLPASERDVPGTHRRYTCDMGGGTAKSFRIPLDVKVCDVQNDTDQDLTFYVSFYDGTTDTPSGLHTPGTSSRIETVAAGSSRPVAQNTEFNSIHFKAGSAATGLVTLRPGAGHENEFGTLEARAIAAVA